MLKEFSILHILLGWALVSFASGQSLTACQDSGLDWYTSFIGETPCQTYQRLRQICTPDYRLGILNTTTPPDNCDDGQGDCCCNSVSFALSMLCLNCQQNIGTGSGSDASIGSYQKYLTRNDGSQCAPNVNQSLPASVQDKACSTQLRIENALYTLFWTDGPWFYRFSRDSLLNDRTTHNNTFTHCPSTPLSTTTSSPSSTVVATSTSQTQIPSASPTSSSSTSEILQTTQSSTTSLSSSSVLNSATTTLSASSSTFPNTLTFSSSSVITTPSLVVVQPQSKVDPSVPSLLDRPGPIVGLVIGFLVFLGCLIAFLCVLWRRRTSRLHGEQTSIRARPFISENSQRSPPMSKSDLMALGTTNRSVSTVDSGTSPYMSLDSVSSGLSIPLLAPAPLPSSQESMSEHHVDAGSVREPLGRSPSGRLPPAYGAQM